MNLKHNVERKNPGKPGMLQGSIYLKLSGHLQKHGSEGEVRTVVTFKGWQEASGSADQVSSLI